MTQATNNTPQTLTITQPDDWHIHLRDEDSLTTTVPHVAGQFKRVICMPNLVPPVKNTAQAMAYHKRIMAHVPKNTSFDPLMVLYLTDQTSPEDIIEAKNSGLVKAVKLYPAGATTNSDAGVTDLANVAETLKTMQEVDLPLLVHGEVTHHHVDIFDREKQFIDEKFSKLVADYPKLRIVFEHITTAEAADFVWNAPANVAATITPQHLMYNRNDMLVGGIRPHFFCLPILKRSTHQTRLLEVATSGSPKYFLGTDSAPHAKHKKENACGCAGCYSAPIALALYAQIFDDAGALDKLEGFASHFGADFYGEPRNTSTITLVKKPQSVPAHYDYLDGEKLVPLMAGLELNWQVQKKA